jgi:hypothetical protein
LPSALALALHLQRQFEGRNIRSRGRTKILLWERKFFTGNAAKMQDGRSELKDVAATLNRRAKRLET